MSASNTARKHTGVIGLGQMGGPMTEHLIEAGFQLVVYDRDPAAMAQAEARGARAASSPRALGEAVEVAIIMVRDSVQAEAALYGEAGFLAGAVPGTVLVVMSSLTSAFVEALEARAQADGVHLLDAPVSGGVEGARAASLTLMCAGGEPAMTAARPVLEPLSGALHWVGERPGLGQTLKALNQAMYFTGLAVAAEALVVGTKAGLDPERMVAVIAASSGDNWALRNRAPLAWRNAYRSGGSLAIARKDLRAARAEAEAQQVPMLVSTATGQLFDLAAILGDAEGDDPEVVRVLERLAGQVIPIPDG